MKLIGTITKVLSPQTGEGKNGTWKKQEYVLTTAGEYPKEVCFEVWGEEKINSFAIKEGASIEASIEIASREYNGRYYTNVKAWAVNSQGKELVQATSNTAAEESDLPF